MKKVLPDSGWEIDLSGWKHIDVATEQWNAAIKANDVPTLIRLMSQVVVRWPYRFNPRKTTHYARLTQAQFDRAAMEINDVFTATFGNRTLTQVKLDRMLAEVKHD